VRGLKWRETQPAADLTIVSVSSDSWGLPAQFFLPSYTKRFGFIQKFIV
jgi:hypothetical protein